MNFKQLIFVILILALTSCERIALLTTPKKCPRLIDTELSMHAENVFWETLHQGNYQGIPEALKLVTAAYLANPYDPRLAAHLGFLHIWIITERARLPTNEPTIVDHIILSKKYFSDAVLLYPHDARYQGFLGSSMLVEGKIFRDEREQVRGYFQLKRAIDQWPEFNYFTAGFTMSSLPVSDEHFKEGLEWQWKTLDLCAGTRVSRINPDFGPFMNRETTRGPLRACWNSWIAPHNFEGFFLNMGDMLVKQGDWPTAIKIYQNATLSSTYESWPYRNLLENRIKNAEFNTLAFRVNPGFQTPAKNPDKTILFNSGYGCVVCHQAR